jgi:hypothetical protein
MVTTFGGRFVKQVGATIAMAAAGFFGRDVGRRFAGNYRELEALKAREDGEPGTQFWRITSSTYGCRVFSGAIVP